MDKHLVLKYMKSPIVLLERLPIKYRNNSLAKKGIRIVNARYDTEDETKREIIKKSPNECTNEIYETIKTDTNSNNETISINDENAAMKDCHPSETQIDVIEVSETEQVKSDDDLSVVTDENMSSLVEGNGDECMEMESSKTGVNVDADECYYVDEGRDILLICQDSPPQIEIDDNKDYVDSNIVGDVTEVMYVNDITIEDNDSPGSREEFNQAINNYLSRIPEIVDIADDSDPEVISLEDENFMIDNSQNLLPSTVQNEHNHTMTALKAKLQSLKHTSTNKYLNSGKSNSAGDAPKNSAYKTLTERFAKFFEVYCFACRSTFPKTVGRIEKNCLTCQASKLRIRCITCKKDYAHCAGLIRHLIQSRSCLPEENRSTIPTQYHHCPYCDYKAAKKWFIKQHILIHTQPHLVEFYTCSKCSRSYKQKDLLRRHERNCGDKPWLICSFCTFTTRHASTLAVHMQRHVIGASSDANNQPSIAPLDTEIVPSVNSNIAECVKQLINQENVESLIQESIEACCSKCKKEAAETDYKCRRCRGSLLYKCKKCQYRKPEYGELRLHIEHNHMKRYTSCPRCAKNILNLREHLTICGKEAHLFCNLCSFSTKYKNSFRNHMVYMHSGVLAEKSTRSRNKFTCGYCTFKTQRKISLVRHIQLMHAAAYTDVNFDCSKCGKDCRNVYVLQKHEATCKL